MKIVADANIPFVSKCFSSIGQVEVFGGRQITTDILTDADVLLIRSITKVNEKLLAGSKVRFVGTATIGFDHIDIDFLRDNNIGFASAPGSNANSAAEYVIAGLLEIGRKHGVELGGKSIGIIGVGNVGGRVAKKCRALGMEVRLNDPPLQRQTGDTKYLPLEELMICDFITMHTPLTFEGQDKTYHLAGRSFFESLKDGCVFVNASRGGVVDSNALEEAVRSRRLQAVVLDVWENEPNIDTNLLKKVDIGTPHIAGYSLDGKIAGMIMIYKSACDYFGLEPEFAVEDFLPEPKVPQIKLDSKADDEQELLSIAVRQVYSIERDAAALRRIVDEPVEKKGVFFDNLRKYYPVRREFQNTTVFAENAGSNLAEKLRGIGFRDVKSDE